MQPQKELLAGDLGGELAHRQVGNLVFRIVPGALRQRLGQIVEQVLAARAGQRRDHEGALEGDRLVGLRGERQQRFAA